MFLKSLHIVQFRNHRESKAVFSQKTICFTGLNGMGKTNVLDAIHYLCTGKSALNAIDSQNVQKGESYFTLKGDFEKRGEAAEIFFGFAANRKKVLKCNQVPYAHLYEHYGKFPCVFVSPADMALVAEGNEERRRFIDSTISVYDGDYLHHLLRYQHTLQQRNAVLKQYKESGVLQADLLDVYAMQMESSAGYLFPKRKAFIQELMPVFQLFAGEINAGHEALEMRYKSDLEFGTLSELLKKNRERDLALARTETGLHKDVFEFETDGQILKKFGSQGQQKSFIMALKLAQARLIEQHLGIKPILLLDDLFDRLDEHRAARLLQLAGNEFDQVFITETSELRLQKAVERAGFKAQFFALQSGVLIGSEELNPL